VALALGGKASEQGKERPWLVRGGAIVRGRRWREKGSRQGRRKSKTSGGAAALFVFPSRATDWFERDGFLGLGFFVLPPNVQNCPPSWVCCGDLYL